MTPPLLDVRNLTVQFARGDGWVTAIDDVSFSVPSRGTVAIVGESGSGKSVTALSILRLLPTDRSRIATGQILFGGRDLATLREARLRAIRGRDIAMVFQDAMSSLNPVHSVGRQIMEPLRVHLRMEAPEARARARELLDRVGIRNAADVLKRFPHELSGGMRQRVMIAIALTCKPRLLIADEPTTALDVTTQAQILELLKELQLELDMTIMIITHDLGVVAQFADSVRVMYAGKIVESAPVDQVFKRSAHPYTNALLNSMPDIAGDPDVPLKAIDGMVPDIDHMPAGCRFHPRCDFAAPACMAATPAMRGFAENQSAACIIDLDERMGNLR